VREIATHDLYCFLAAARAVARMSQQGGQKSQKGTHFLIQCWMYADTATKKVACAMLILFILNATQKVIQTWTPNLLSTVNWCCAIWAREETRNSVLKLCKPLKLLSPCKLFSLFTFALRPLFHVSLATAYQAGHYTAEIMQVYDTTWQLKHKSRKNVILWTSPFRTNFVKEWFWLISGINIALFSGKDILHWDSLFV